MSVSGRAILKWLSRNRLVGILRAETSKRKEIFGIVDIDFHSYAGLDGDSGSPDVG